MTRSTTDKKPTYRRWSDKFIMPVLVIAVSIAAITSAVAIFFSLKYGLGNNPTVEFFNQPFPTDTLQYHRGDTVSYIVQYKKYTNVPALTGKQLICTKDDGTTYRSNPVNSFGGAEATPDGTQFQVSESTFGIIPDNAPLNVPCYISIIARYEINFLRKPLVKSITTTFTIVGDKAKLEPRPEFKTPTALPETSVNQESKDKNDSTALPPSSQVNVTVPPQPQNTPTQQNTQPVTNIAPVVNISPQAPMQLIPEVPAPKLPTIPLVEEVINCIPVLNQCQ